MRLGGEIKVKGVDITSGELTINYETTGKIQRVITGNEIFLSADRDFSQVPESVAVIPFVSTVAPVCWALDAQLTIPELDSDYLEALRKIKPVIAEMNPSQSWRGQLTVSSIETNKPPVSGDPLALFSGGVDSLATYARHQDENPSLVPIHGSDISIENESAWQELKQGLEKFAAKEENSQLIPIKTDIRECIDHNLLASYLGVSSKWWWIQVQHGLLLTSLPAPLAYLEGSPRLYIASSHWFPRPWASHPEIDNKVRYAGIQAVHDGYELTRQDKMGVIADYLRSVRHQPTIRSCYESNSGDNCSNCEKCCRTILGLELEGIDPNNHGYSVDSTTFEYMQDSLVSGEWHLKDTDVRFWKDLQSHCERGQSLPHSKAEEFVEWFVDVDEPLFENAKGDHKPPFADRVIPYLKYLPYPLYKNGLALFRLIS
ncbi:hypothetical protein [Haloferax sp. Atlit-19N]|uniref:hypothetical protein n=1 Tax=Haloferax sp. Atlit-19N TaxID=2077201 RepID=UPI0011C055FD|nr:hypothetical protein [Haloferax sp. Atlit-19N]